MSISHAIPEKRLFQNLTLKIQGQGHGWGECWKSKHRSNYSIDSHPFHSMSIGHVIPEIQLFQNLTLKIQGQSQMTMVLHNYRSSQFPGGLRGNNRWVADPLTFLHLCFCQKLWTWGLNSTFSPQIMKKLVSKIAKGSLIGRSFITEINRRFNRPKWPTLRCPVHRDQTAISTRIYGGCAPRSLCPNATKQGLITRPCQFMCARACVYACYWFA